MGISWEMQREFSCSFVKDLFLGMTMGLQSRISPFFTSFAPAEVLFDGANHPVPVALRHLQLGSGAANGRSAEMGEMRRMPGAGG